MSLKILPWCPPGTGKCAQLDAVLPEVAAGLIVVAHKQLHYQWMVELRDYSMWCVSPRELKTFLEDINPPIGPLVVDELHRECYTDEFFALLRNSGRRVFMLPPRGVPLPINIFKDAE
jgi:hypothetical protein